MIRQLCWQIFALHVPATCSRALDRHLPALHAAASAPNLCHASNPESTTMPTMQTTPVGLDSMVCINAGVNAVEMP